MRQVSTSLIVAGALALAAGGAFAADARTAPQLADSYSYGVVGVQAEPGSELFYVRYDTDGDGDLSDELVVVRTRAELEREGYLTSNHAMQPGSDVFYVRYDTDGDGDLSDEQVVLRTRDQVEQENGKVVLYEDHALEAVDRNGDGYISADEWVAERGAHLGSLDLDNNGIPDGDE